MLWKADINYVTILGQKLWHATHNKERKGVLHFRPMNISVTGEIDLSAVKYVEESNYDPLMKGDIVFNNTNSPELIGKTTYIKQDTNWAYSNHMTKIRVNTELLDPVWIAFFLHTKYLQGFFKMQCTHHVNQASINSSYLSQRVNIPLPPLPEQHRIVAKIEELLTQLDAGVASLKKAQTQLKRYRQAVLKAAFEGRLTQEWREEHKGEIEPAEILSKKITGEQKKWNHRKSKEIENIDIRRYVEIPEEWISTQIQNIARVIQYGSSEKADDNTSGIPIIRMGNLKDGKIDFSNLKYISKNSPDISKCLLQLGDVLFNRTNSAELVGKTAVFNRESYEAVFASYLIRVRVDNELYSPDFLSYYINSSFGRKYISSVVSQQVGQANVNGTKLANMVIPYPDISEQKEIISEIERHFSQIDHVEQTIETSLRQAETLRQTILKQAFEGKLVPQDPNDEPASVLLERIKAEKASRAAEGKKGKTLQRRSPKRTIKNAD
ncbi:MAG: restriction endonuclease subunit S [Methanolinea sp.]|jgi:type I restriction enzyme S subunit